MPANTGSELHAATMLLSETPGSRLDRLIEQDEDGVQLGDHDTDDNDDDDHDNHGDGNNNVANHQEQYDGTRARRKYGRFRVLDDMLSNTSATTTTLTTTTTAEDEHILVHLSGDACGSLDDL